MSELVTSQHVPWLLLMFTLTAKQAMPLPQFQPMPLGRASDPFSHSEWLYEVKWDGFRSLAYVQNGDCRPLFMDA